MVTGKIVDICNFDINEEHMLVLSKVCLRHSQILHIDLILVEQNVQNRTYTTNRIIHEKLSIPCLIMVFVLTLYVVQTYNKYDTRYNR